METVKKHIVDFITVPTVEEYYIKEWSNGTGYGDGEGSGRACGGNVHLGICITEKPNTNNLKSLVSYCGHPVYHIEDMSVILYNVVGKAAYAALILPDLSIKKGILVRYGNSFAFAEHAKEAFEKAKELSTKRGWELVISNTQEYMLSVYPNVDNEYSVKDLLTLHNLLTGSCAEGREAFIKEHHIDTNSTATLRTFFEYSKYAFGKESIAEVAKLYGITI